MTMTRECDRCGAEFETLTKKRLHDCPVPDRGPTEWEEYELDDPSDEDEFVDKMMDGLLTCVECGEKTDGVEEIEQEVSEAGVYVSVDFECPHCGRQQTNEAEAA